MALITAPRYGDTATILDRYKRLFATQHHVPLDVLGTYGCLPVHEPDGESVDAFDASERGAVPKKLLRSKSVTFGQKLINGHNVDYVYLILDQDQQDSSSKQNEKTKYKYKGFPIEQGNTIIRYRRSSGSPTKYRCWKLPYWQKLLRRKQDGTFVTKAPTLRLYPVVDVLPECFQGMDIRMFGSNMYMFPYVLGDSGCGAAVVGEGYWLTGSWPELRYLSKDEISQSNLLVSLLDSDGEVSENIGNLAELVSTKQQPVLS